MFYDINIILVFLLLISLGLNIRQLYLSYRLRFIYKLILIKKNNEVYNVLDIMFDEIIADWRKNEGELLKIIADKPLHFQLFKVLKEYKNGN